MANPLLAKVYWNSLYDDIISYFFLILLQMLDQIDVIIKNDMNIPVPTYGSNSKSACLIWCTFLSELLQFHDSGAHILYFIIITRVFYFFSTENNFLYKLHMPHLLIFNLWNIFYHPCRSNNVPRSIKKFGNSFNPHVFYCKHFTSMCVLIKGWHSLFFIRI